MRVSGATRSGRSQFRYVQPYYPKWAFLNANATLSGPATWHLFADDRVVRPGDGLGSAACLAATPRSPLGASAARSRALERCRRCKQTLGQAAEADRCAARAGRATAPLWRRAASVRLLMPCMPSTIFRIYAWRSPAPSTAAGPLVHVHGKVFS